MTEQRAPGGALPSPATARGSPLDILVVDDDEPNLLAIEAALGDLGPRLVTARSGREALRHLLDQEFALILLDVRMPGMDGFETARLIRSRTRRRHIPIVFITAYDQSDARVLEGYGLGAVDFLFKPIVPEILRAKASVFVDLQQQTAEVARQAEQLRRQEAEQAGHRLAEERQRWEQDALRREMAEQQVATEALARKAEELARTVAERETAQRELTRINSRLAEADRRKDEFLATLAHELRNPLAPLAYAVGLLEGTSDPILEEARVRMDRQLAYISRLVDDLMDISRVTAGKIELRRQAIDLRDVVLHALEVSRPSIDEHGHRVELEISDEPMIVDGDAVRLSQIVSNLLNNAARYTERPGRIAVRARREGGDVLIEVVDDGQGIPEELLDRIFGAFVQARTGGGGLGLGLHLVRHLVRLHGGSVRASSPGVGQGSAFTVRLQALEPRLAFAHEKTAEHVPTTAARRLRVVVVEDQDDVREMLVLLLNRWGHDIASTDTGVDGVRLVVQSRPDLVLVDIGLPDIDGYEVASRAREHLGAECPPLIAVTGWGQEHDRARAASAGFARHLVKPVSPRELRQLLLES